LQKFKDSNKVRYCIFSLEQGESQKEQNTHHFHFQGYLEFFAQIDVNAFNKEFRLTHIESARASSHVNEKYVRKEKTSVLNENGEKYL
jgi:hypothetical protein